MNRQKFFTGLSIAGLATLLPLPSLSFKSKEYTPEQFTNKFLNAMSQFLLIF